MIRSQNIHFSFIVYFIFLTFIFSCTVSAQNGEKTTVFKGATLFDGTGSDPIENSVITMSGQRIDCVGTEAECSTPKHAGVIEIDGKFIVPGLIDAHVHFFQTGFFDSRPDALDITEVYPFPMVVAYQKLHPQRYYDAYLCSGITGVYDVGRFSWSIDFQQKLNQIPWLLM